MESTFASDRFEDIEEYRIRASRLMKALRAGDPEAVQRMRAAPGGTDLAPEQWKRKHALAVVAMEAGYAGWTDLKAALERQREFDPAMLLDRPTGGFLNLWYRSYVEARAVLEGEARRYLFPYRSQYFVCEAGLIEAAGVDPMDPDWDRMGRDWVQPADDGARDRLAVRLRRALTSGTIKA